MKKVGRKEKKGIGRDVPLSSKAVEAYEQQKKTRKPDEPRIFWQWKDTSSFDKAFNLPESVTAIPPLPDQSGIANPKWLLA